MRGKLLETRILNKVNSEKNKNFTQNLEKKVLNYNLFELVGIPDGIDYKERKIIEIKTKSNLDMSTNTIKNREICQVLAYMSLYNCCSCLFVETGPNNEIKETIIEYNNDQFQKILSHLTEICSIARNLTETEYKYLIGNNK